jgi:hypothetical protein
MDKIKAEREDHQMAEVLLKMEMDLQMEVVQAKAMEHQYLIQEKKNL